jgi:hypothetical protein
VVADSAGLAGSVALQFVCGTGFLGIFELLVDLFMYISWIEDLGLLRRLAVVVLPTAYT